MDFPATRPGAMIALLALVLVTPSASAQPHFFRRELADPPSQEVTAEFLVGDSGGLEPRKGTAWRVHFARGMHKGLYITGAWYKRSLGEDWIKILNDARISEEKRSGCSQAAKWPPRSSLL